MGTRDSILTSSPAVTVVSSATGLAFVPVSQDEHAALLFLCGSGVTAEAGHPVHIVRLPLRFAPHERTLANRLLLPDHTVWEELVGGNHSQFGRFGRQLCEARRGSAARSRKSSRVGPSSTS